MSNTTTFNKLIVGEYIIPTVFYGAWGHTTPEKFKATIEAVAPLCNADVTGDENGVSLWDYLADEGGYKGYDDFGDISLLNPQWLAMKFDTDIGFKVTPKHPHAPKFLQEIP